jgi:hypothetical protein
VRGLQWCAASRRRNDAARGPSIELRRSAGEQAAAAAGGAARALQRCVLRLGRRVDRAAAHMSRIHSSRVAVRGSGADRRSRGWHRRAVAHGIPSRFNPGGKKMSQKKFMSTAYLVIPLTLLVIGPSSRDYCDCM